MDGMAALALVFHTWANCQARPTHLYHVFHLTKQWTAEAATMSGTAPASVALVPSVRAMDTGPAAGAHGARPGPRLAPRKPRPAAAKRPKHASPRPARTWPHAGGASAARDYPSDVRQCLDRRQGPYARQEQEDCKEQEDQDDEEKEQERG